ncbi:hypothetical protein [uncultured Lentibacter sp.]|uniref:hypothetical protein n=1 Tax=uncultured Lentibacter sp. TaxID=1659309 RepID=UPI00261B9A10|nr:hypothetical protein [uncultured Lentibacter sp.]
MTDYLSPEIEAALKAARKAALKKSSRLRVQMGETQYPILKLWDKGFALDVTNAPKLRGLVDIYDGAKHLLNGLIIATEEEGDMMHYEFKRATQAHDKAPLDYERDTSAPVALIGKAAPSPH